MTEHERELIAWNKAKHSKADIKKVQAVLGLDPDGVWGIRTQTAVEVWQYEHDLKPDGKVGPKTLQAMQKQDATQPHQEWRRLTDDEIDKIIEFTVAEEAGSANPYDDMNTDNEYEGWHDTPHRHPETKRKLTPQERAEFRKDNPGIGKAHPASMYHESGGYHIGLSGGILSFAQSPGSLGTMMQMAFELDPDQFAEDFGPNHGQMRRTLLAGKGPIINKRGPNCQPIGGKDMWEKPWTTRFDAAADKPYFRKAQRMAARQGYFEPAIELCKEYGFSGQADLAVAFDMCVQFGPGGARKRFKRAKEAHGDEMTILDVVDEIEEPHRRDRRLRIIEKAEVFVVYEDLVTC